MSPRVRIVIGSSSTALPRFVIASLVVHVLFVVALVAAPALRPAPSRIEDSIVVDLVAAPTPAAAAPVRAPAEPQPESPPPPPEERPAAPPPRRPKPKPDAPSLAAERTEREPEPPTAPSPDPAAVTPAPGEAAEGPAVVEGGFADVSAADSQMSWYRGVVIAALYSNWRKPVVEAIREPIEVNVTFEISADGRVANLRVERESGIPSLDRSALRAVTEASPFPPLPPSWRRPSLPAAFVFQLRPES